MTRRQSVPRPRRSTRDWRSTLRLLVTAAAAAASLGAAYNFVLVPLTGTFNGPFEDFSAYAHAARSVATGVTPYGSFNGATIVMTGFDYPPFAAVLLRPLAVLPARWQELTWLWISLAALVGGAVVTARALLPASWPRARLAALVALTFPPATYNLWHGQMNTIIFLFLAVALSDYLAGRRTRCAIVLGIAAGIKLAPVVLLLVLVRRGWWRAAAAGACTAAATVAAGVAALGWGVTRQYLTSVLPVLDRDNGWIYNQSWNGVVNRVAQHSVLTVDPPYTALRVVTILLSLATVAILLVAVSGRARTRAERGAEFACGVTAMLLIGTITWYPILLHLLIPIAAAAGLAYERGRAGRRLAGWSVVTLAGVGLGGGGAISVLTIHGIASLSGGPLWWVFLQAVSLPAVLTAGLLVVLAGALREQRRIGGPVRAAALAQ